jgi:hypothetical protein
VSNFPKQSSLVHWATSLEKLVVEGTDALRNCSVETADFLNRGFLYFSDHSRRLCPKLQMHMNRTVLTEIHIFINKLPILLDLDLAILSASLWFTTGDGHGHTAVAMIGSIHL